MEGSNDRIYHVPCSSCCGSFQDCLYWVLSIFHTASMVDIWVVESKGSAWMFHGLLNLYLFHFLSTLLYSPTWRSSSGFTQRQKQTQTSEAFQRISSPLLCVNVFIGSMILLRICLKYDTSSSATVFLQCDTISVPTDHSVLDAFERT